MSTDATPMDALDKATTNDDVTFLTLSESVTFFADQAAVSSVSAESDARRLWCAWVLPAGQCEVHRVYLVEAEQGCDLVRLARRIAGQITVFDSTAHVEVFEPETPQSPHVQGALNHGRLLWVRERRPSLEIAWILVNP
jgi:hypothetical protein